ncbi:Craniofacial development protein 2, partial [Blattella germanica]
MLQPGKMLEIIKEAAKVNIDVLAIQETRWAGQGRIDKQNYSVFYSGPNTRTGQCGTGFMISAKVRKNLMSFIPLGDRMCKIRLNGRFRNITLISVYAPTEDGKEEEKHNFYNQLYNECTKIPKHDIVIILGDFNAQIGKYTLHTKTNENGKLLSELAMANRLIIKSTCFKHKKIRKGMWKIPGGEQVNQIDHIL